MVVAIIIILALIGIFSLSGGQLTPPNISIGPPGNGGGGGGEVPGQTQGAASSFILVIFIAVAILGMVVGTRYIRNRPMRESVAIERYEQHQADQLLDQAMKELYAGEDIKAVIVRTYQQMCRLIGGPMLGSALYLTPREFAELAVRRLNWPEGPVLALTGLFTLIADLARAFPAGMVPAVAALVISIPVLLYLKGPLIVIELLSFVGNMLSYARLMAVGVASVYLAFVANMFAGMVGNIVIGVIIAALIHAINQALAFSPTIQSARLHYVEFFGKFYKPGGKEYKPFKRGGITP
jgi:ABC-type multidrug transport system fused ATPase/permease subunit